MANISVTTANRIEVVQSLEQDTQIAAEAILAGSPVRIETSTGKFTPSNATSGAEARIYGIATKTVQAGEPVTAIRRGVLAGFTLSGAYDSIVYLSDTDGRVADAAGTIAANVGRVIAGNAELLGASADKLFLVDCSGGVATQAALAVTVADALTVGGVIVPQGIEVEVNCLLNTHCVDQAFFTANRAYQVTAVREIHATAGNDGSAVSVQVVKDTGTDAPGAGTNLLTNNTNAGFDMKGMANTVQTGALSVTAADLQLAAGNRLSLDFAGVVTTLAGVQVTVSLKAI